MFENIMNFFKSLVKKEKEQGKLRYSKRKIALSFNAR